MANEPKWTPGPWVVKPSSEYWGHYELRQTSDSSYSGIVDDANARLISAAPQMYEALKAILDHWDVGIGGPEKWVRLLRDRGFIDGARAALAKARGES